MVWAAEAQSHSVGEAARVAEKKRRPNSMQPGCLQASKLCHSRRNAGQGRATHLVHEDAAVHAVVRLSVDVLLRGALG